jgi:hypothetical protein
MDPSTQLGAERSKRYELELNYVRSDYDENLKQPTFRDYSFIMWEVDNEIGRFNGEEVQIWHDLIHDTLRLTCNFGNTDNYVQHTLFDEGPTREVLDRLNIGFLKEKLKEICFEDTD